MSNPPGHQPGVHAPGTTVPIAYIVGQQQHQADVGLVVADLQRKRRRNLLILMR